MKKLFLTVLSVFTAFTLFCFSGCAKNDSSSEEPKGPQGDYKIAFLGDSITDKGVYSDLVTTHYTDYVYDNCSFVSSIQNVGYAGSCIAGLPNKQGVNPSFVQRYKRIDANADVIMILGGTNDFGYGSSALPNPLGEFGDDTAETFYGGLKVLIDGLQTDYPDAEIIFITPLYRREQESNGIPNKNIYGFTLAEYVDAIKQTCENRNIVCFDAFNDLTEINAFTYEQYEVDGLHLNNEGNVLLGSYLKDKLTETLE